MKKAAIITLAVSLISFMAPATAQEEPGDAAMKEAQSLERELVNKVRLMLKNQEIRKAVPGKKPEDIEARAELPALERHDLKKLNVELAEWKEKSNVFTDILKDKKLVEIQNEFDAKVKKLEEKARKTEKVVINPRRKPLGERKREQIERAFRQEVEKLKNEHKMETRKIEKEAEYEKKVVGHLIREIEKILSSASSRKEREERHPKGDH